MTGNISELTQELHDLIFCRTPTNQGNGKSRASRYFKQAPGEKPPTDDEMDDLADMIAEEVSAVLSKLPADHGSIPQCQYSLSHCGYDLDGKRKLDS